MRVLLFVSGGFDSTAVLLHVLKNTDYQIHAVRIKRNIDVAGANQERLATQAVIAYAQKQYPGRINFDEISPENGATSIGMRTTRPLAAKLAAEAEQRGEAYDKIVTGRTKSDYEAAAGRFERRAGQAHALFAEAFMAHGGSREPCWWYPLRDASKLDVLRSIPKALLAKLWTCPQPASPHNLRSCRDCQACKDVIQALKQDMKTSDGLLAEAMHTRDYVQYTPWLKRKVQVRLRARLRRQAGF